MSFRKHSVRTNYDKYDKSNRIISCIKEHPEGINPKSIALETGINHSTVRNLLKQRMSEISQKGLRGMYYYVGNDGDRVLSEWTLQNAVISCNLPSYLGERIQESFGDKEVVKYDFEIGSLSKKATLHLSAQIPINISSISVYCNLFKLLVEKYEKLEVKEEDIWISTIEFQKDFKGLRIDGTNAITLTNLISQFKVYNKEYGLRKEHKITSTVTAEVLLNLLSSETNSIDMLNEISYIKERIRKMENSFRTSTHLLGKILEKLDNRPI